MKWRPFRVVERPLLDPSFLAPWRKGRGIEGARAACRTRELRARPPQRGFLVARQLRLGDGRPAVTSGPHMFIVPRAGAVGGGAPTVRRPAQEALVGLPASPVSGVSGRDGGAARRACTSGAATCARRRLRLVGVGWQTLPSGANIRATAEADEGMGWECGQAGRMGECVCEMCRATRVLGTRWRRSDSSLTHWSVARW